LSFGFAVIGVIYFVSFALRASFIVIDWFTIECRNVLPVMQVVRSCGHLHYVRHLLSFTSCHLRCARHSLSLIGLQLN